MLRFVTHSPAQTEAVAEALAPSLHAGQVLLLTGGLGAGKTAFVRGLVRGLGGDENEVSSPTFALMNQYGARLTVRHFDLYRLSGADEVYDLGFDEFFRAGDGVCAVEWHSVAGADFWRGMDVLAVELSGEGEHRAITVEGEHESVDVGRLVQLGVGVHRTA